MEASYEPQSPLTGLSLFLLPPWGRTLAGEKPDGQETEPLGALVVTPHPGDAANRCGDVILMAHGLVWSCVRGNFGPVQFGTRPGQAVARPQQRGRPINRDSSKTTVAKNEF